MSLTTLALSSSPVEKCKHLSLFLGIVNPQSLPSGWRRELKFRLTLVNKDWRSETKVLEGQRWFDASKHAWGFKEFMPLSTIRYRNNRFLVGDKLVIVAELHVFPADVLPDETVKMIEPRSCSEGDQAADSFVQKYRNAASQEKVDCGVSQEIPCDDASKEVLDDDDGVFEEGLNVDDVDASEWCTDDQDASEENVDGGGANEEGSDDDEPEESQNDDDGSREKIPLNQSNLLKEGSLTVGHCEDTGDDDVIQIDQGDDNASSPVSGVSDRDVSSLDTFEDASQRVEDGDMKCNKVTSVITEASNDFSKEVQSLKETKDVNDFQVFSSHVESVSHIFKRHPNIALGFRPKNQEIRKAYMNELLSLIEMMCQSPEKLSVEDLRSADDTLADLIDVRFQLDWLKTKLNEVSEKKKKEKGSDARLRTIEEELQKLKLMFLDIETQLQKEKGGGFGCKSSSLVQRCCLLICECVTAFDCV